MSLAAYLARVIAVGALLAGPARSADEAVDADFLEFLGSVDSSEAGWHDFLATTDVDALLKAREAAAKPADPGATPPANEPEKEP
jgi:hypothetical protein